MSTNEPERIDWLCEQIAIETLKLKNNPMYNLPCDALLHVAMNLDPVSYARLSMVSDRIYRCLHKGKYSAEVSDKIGAALRQKKKEYREQLAAVQQNGYAIEYIRNPSEQVRLAAADSY